MSLFASSASCLECLAPPMTLWQLLSTLFNERGQGSVTQGPSPLSLLFSKVSAQILQKAFYTIPPMHFQVLFLCPWHFLNYYTF